MRHSNIAIAVRLACVRHAANVHPEPGSNSPFDFTLETDKAFALLCYLADGFFCLPRCPSTAFLPSHSSVVKLRPRTLRRVKVVLSLLPVFRFVKRFL